MSKRSVNLIPVATQRRHSMRRLVRVWSTAIVLSGACSASLLGVEWARGLIAMQELSELDARYEPFVRIAGEQRSLANQVSALRAREQLSLRLSRDDHGLSLLGSIAQAAGASAGDVYVEQLSYDGAIATGSRDEKVTRSVRIEGAGVDSVAVAAFAERLRKSNVFSGVAVESTAPLPGGAASLRRFVVAAAL
ncbi:MAG: hypothetical protein AAF266_04515 [Planctomycetota bacterium]